MKKLNQSGFVLAETLVVAVFLMVIFTMIFNNFYPLIGEYAKRENYDTVDGKYAIYWIKRMIEDASYSLSSTKKGYLNSDPGYVQFSCQDVSTANGKRQTCIELVHALQVDGCSSIGTQCKIFLTKYRIGRAGAAGGHFFKEEVAAGATTLFPDGFKDYVMYLPDFTATSLNYANYRVLARFHNTKDDNDIYSYATIEVSR